MHQVTLLNVGLTADQGVWFTLTLDYSHMNTVTFAVLCFDLQIRASDVVLPEGAVSVIANSLTVSNKAETAAGLSNIRVLS